MHFWGLPGPGRAQYLHPVSKRQTAASHSTPEAEIVAADLGIRTEGLPALCLWEVLLDRAVLCVLCEDNEAGIRILETGRNPTIRHLGRVHKVGIAFLHECYERGDVIMQYTPTDRQSADIFTKCFLLTDKWIHARNLIATAVELNEAYQAVSGEQACVGNEPTHVYGDPCPRSEGREEYERMLGITSEAEVPDEPADCLEKVVQVARLKEKR